MQKKRSVSQMSVLQRRGSMFHQWKRWISQQSMALPAGCWLTPSHMRRTHRHDLDAKVFRFRYLDSLLERVHAMMLELLEPVCRADGFTFDQYLILTSLREGLAFTATELARQSRRNSGSITRIVDQLERLVLVQRLRGASDRRIVQLRLTVSGQTAIDTLEPKMLTTLDLALHDISSEDIETLERLLLAVLMTMGSLHGPVTQKSWKATALKPCSPAT
jgi:DNA-binding MarR family transcriptional regulator